MQTNRINNLQAKFDLLCENNFPDTMEELFSSEIDHFRVRGYIIEVECPAPGSRRKKICKVTFPTNLGRKS